MISVIEWSSSSDYSLLEVVVLHIYIFLSLSLSLLVFFAFIFFINCMWNCPLKVSKSRFLIIKNDPSIERNLKIAFLFILVRKNSVQIRSCLVSVQCVYC